MSRAAQRKCARAAHQPRTPPPPPQPARYNLRAANESLKANWGEYMTRCTFNWRMIKGIITECHVFDDKRNYR